MSITFRTPGPWGSGTSADLTPNQVDFNFWTLWSLYLAIQAQVPTADIDYFNISGTSLYVHLTNHTVLGPYTLPVWQPIPVGEWQPSTQYYVSDELYNEGVAYLVLVQHVSPAHFDPDYQVGGQNVYSPPILMSPASVMPVGGEVGQVLIATSAGGSNPPSVEWGYLLPFGGSPGDVLTLVHPGDSTTPAATEWSASAPLEIGGYVFGGTSGNILYVDGSGLLDDDTLSDLLDSNFSSTPGSVLVRGTSGWEALAPGTAGYFLETLGSGTTPVWAPLGAGVELQVGLTPIFGSVPNELLYSDGTELQGATLGSGLEIVDGVLDITVHGGGGGGFDFFVTGHLQAGQVPIYNGSYWTNESVVFPQSVKKSFTTADLLAISGPITLVDAPGPGFVIVPISIYAVAGTATTPFQGASGSATNFGYGAVYEFYPFQDGDPFIDNTTVISFGAWSGVASDFNFSDVPTNLENQPLTMHISGSGVYGANWGALTGATTDFGGTGYSIGDTGTINQVNSSGDATYQVTSVLSGAVTGFTLTGGGTAYLAPATAAPTAVTTGGGDGTFTVNISSNAVGNGSGSLTVTYFLMAV